MEGILTVDAHLIIRFVPYLYLVSPSTGREAKLRVDLGLKAMDAKDMAERCLSDRFIDTPLDVLQQSGRVNLAGSATDWRFMTEPEIDAFLARDALEDAGPGTEELDEPTETPTEDWTDAA